MKNILFLTLLFSASFSYAAEEETLVEGATCTHGKEVRKLEAITNGKGCLAHYTKGGKTSKIGESIKGVELCREKMRSVRDNLVKSGYTCK